MTNTFRDLHFHDEPLLLPNAWDFGSAALLAAAGFPAVGTTSLGIAAAAGLPDGIGATAAETRTLARRLARLPIPVTVDIEAGFHTDPAEIAAFVADLAEFGTAGVNVEDGRTGTALADADHQADIIRAIKTRTPDIFVNARVDTYWLRMDRTSTISRARKYTEAGADGVFVPGVTDLTEIAQFARAVPVPLNVLYSTDGPNTSELAAAGVRRISTGSLLYRRALGAAVEAFRAVRTGQAVVGKTPTYSEIQLSISDPGHRVAR
ncbi:isocitrate lyase/phosphoenolpyruvate mutase family protein [Nocardia otitidiscaviarum]|uniref:Isocitrate lyase/phosphoenolpyruvate mutase family protein n=1 Tax=Nocardia otitidiscaviarum TaxID=1823 RepID=A0A516NPQ0_9NOCA|nr:isocitrate lyase/phosphoenolpyruvate mutase family protein [Nocardia otitidiscaviarum]MCP9622281.1 isocitrate lyase/phosphoenolpyruvate mutase family protein [Nocardia otitidiscaviarum]QDP80882.1 isocitrate lyase/phosphoenolpyruvate mutase family protein [Nocardia otitidiscaviarum]